jgi:hypothetical protein
MLQFIPQNSAEKTPKVSHFLIKFAQIWDFERTFIKVSSEHDLIV